MIPISGLRVGDPCKRVALKSDRGGNLRGVVEPEVFVIGGGGAGTASKRRKALQVLVGFNAIVVVHRKLVDVGVVFGNTVDTDAGDGQEENGALRPVKLLHAAGGFLILRFLGLQKMKERHAGEDERRKEIEISCIGQNKAKDHV